MLPLSQQKRADISLVKVLFPETILVTLTFLYCFIPWLVWGKIVFISFPVHATLTYAFFFSIIQSVIFCHVWKWCKLNHDFNNKAEYDVKEENGNIWFKGTTIFLLCWFVFHALCVLLGAPLIERSLETTTWAFLISTLVSVPNLCIFGPDVLVWYRVIVCGKYTNSTERFLYFQSIGAALGSWCSVIVIPLDWDRDWQVWPIPCIFGCLFGYTMSVLLSCLFTIQELKRTKVQ